MLRPSLSQLTQNLKSSLIDNPRRVERANIISEDLCDDILQRLSPTLARHTGCDIIDINPGAGLWSSKIHEHVKPRRHILAEPRKDFYLPYLKPLLESPGSRYHLQDVTGWEERELWRIGRYQQAGLLPGPKHSAEHGGVEGRNDSLLVLANMSLFAPKSKKKLVGQFSSPHARLFDFARAVQEKSGFHSNGKVRLLMWLNDGAKSFVIPQTIVDRRRITALTDMIFHAEEVAGDVVPARFARRETPIELESSMRALNRMEEQNIKIPENRLGERTRAAQEAKDEEVNATVDSGTSGEAVVHRQWHEELRALEQAFEEGKLSQYIDGPPGIVEVRNKRKGSAVFTEEFLRLRTLRHTNANQRHNKLSADDFLQEREKIDSMYLEIVESELSEQERELKLLDLDRRIAQLKVRQEKLSANKLSATNFLDDERRAFKQNPPLLVWDSRASEPLGVTEDEFQPAKPLALLDIQPKDTETDQLTPTQWIYVEAVTEHMYNLPKESVVDVLDSIAPGAAKAIIPQVPSLRDPRRGGRRDVDQIRVRMLTPEMLRGLAIAFQNWSHGPSLPELMRTEQTQEHGRKHK